MKTFKLVSFRMKDKQGKRIQIPFEDGLIINNENEKRTWMLELFFKKEYLHHFDEYENHEEFPVSVIITRQDNDPAFFDVKIVSRKIIDEYVTVLMEGKIRRKDHRYAEKLLETLIEEGLSGEALLTAFKKEMAEQRNKAKR